MEEQFNQLRRFHDEQNTNSPACWCSATFTNGDGETAHQFNIDLNNTRAGQTLTATIVAALYADWEICMYLIPLLTRK